MFSFKTLPRSHTLRLLLTSYWLPCKQGRQRNVAFLLDTLLPPHKTGALIKERGKQLADSATLLFCIGFICHSSQKLSLQQPSYCKCSPVYSWLQLSPWYEQYPKLICTLDLLPSIIQTAEPAHHQKLIS